MGLVDSVGSVIGNALKKGPVSPPDLSQLFKMIDAAGAQQKTWIDAMPSELKTQYDAYKASNAGAANTLTSTLDKNNTDYASKMESIYDPNSPAVKAALDAAKVNAYSEIPGQQDMIREALAATGGFDRGTASKQLVAPVLQAASNFNKAAMGISADQLQKQQAATQAAVEKINNIDDQTAQTLFGMSRDQALQILTTGRQDLKDQLASLINQSQTQTNAKLGVEGANLQNQYNYDVAKNADANNKINGWVNLGTDVASSVPAFMSGMGGSPTTVGGVGGTTTATPQFGQTWSPALA